MPRISRVSSDSPDTLGGRHRRGRSRQLQGAQEACTSAPARDLPAGYGPAGGDPIIEARGLGRTFKSRGRTVNAVRNVSFTVHRGEIVGFLGPNGAGKTTTMRMLTTLLPATVGDALIAGSSLRYAQEQVRRSIGYVAQGGGAHPDHRVMEELILQAQLYQMTRRQAEKESRRLCALLGLGGLEDRQTKTLSGGQRRRLDIALGLVHRPELLFLDEPTTALDPRSRNTIWEYVRRLREEGMTVFLTTHYLDEADALCDRILFMNNGTLADEGSPDDIKRKLSADIVTIELNGYPEDAWRVLEGHVGIREMTVSGLALNLTLADGDRAIPGLVRALDAAGIPIAAVRVSRPTLDDAFNSLTGNLPSRQRNDLACSDLAH